MSTGHSTEQGYRVEARHTEFIASNPIKLYDGILTSEWREITFQRGHNPCGIPEDAFSRKGDHDLLSYNAAMALAWTLIAQQKHRMVECRLVAYKLETTWKCEKVGLVVMEPLNSMEHVVSKVDEANEPNE